MFRFQKCFSLLLSQTICLLCPQRVLKRRFSSRISTPPESPIAHARLGWYIIFICYVIFFCHMVIFGHLMFFFFSVSVMLFLVLRLIMVSLILTDNFLDHIQKNYSTYQMYKCKRERESCPRQSLLVNFPFSFVPR